jgi:DNA (cytosine-5)-methyltransferase 1
MAAYYNEHNPKLVPWLRALIRDGLIADGEVDERSITDVDSADVAGFAQCHWFAGVGGWSLALRLDVLLPLPAILEREPRPPGCG